MPDLVYHKGDDTWIVVDWKSGRNKRDDIVQASVYALYVREYFGASAENIKERVECLYHGKMEEYSFTDSDLEERTDAIERKHCGYERLSAGCRPEPAFGKNMFPMRADTSSYRFCNYYQLDRDEIYKLAEGPL